MNSRVADTITDCSRSSELSPPTVSVRAPARLHFGFINLSERHGRMFGSVGVSLGNIATEMTFKGDDCLCVEAYDPGIDCDVVLRKVTMYCERANLPKRAYIRIKTLVPAHQGLGSGTQMALTIGHGMSRLRGDMADSRDIARLMGRGSRSGIGIAAFDLGGFIVDEGKRDKGPPRIAVRHQFPDEWCFVLARDESGMNGLHGDRERDEFTKLFGQADDMNDANKLRHLVDMNLLPAIAGRDFDETARTIGELQAAMGRYFQSSQGGCYISASVRRVMDIARGFGYAGIGQSSWGPTGFILCRNQGEGEALCRAIESELPTDVAVSLSVAFADNGGQRVTTNAAIG